jgi:glycosyltransferase involved in cell wall biosynthesis
VGDPWLSVVMPTYNGAALVGSALDSVVAQGGDVEVIAIDDGSTDGTLEILHAFRDRLPVAVVECPHVGNWVANANLGLARARGRYVSILHQDDRWLPERLAVLRPLLEAAPAVTLALHPSWYIDATGHRVGCWRCPLPPGVGRLAPEAVVERLLVQNFVAMPAPTFPREAAARVGPLDETLWYTADWDLWLRLAAIGPTLYCPRPLAEFRVHALSQTMRGSAETGAFRRQLESVVTRHLQAWPVTGRRRQRVSRVAWFSVEVNTRLAALAHGGSARGLSLLVRFLLLGPGGWYRYWRDAGLLERVRARLRAGVRPGPVPAGVRA